MNAREVIGLVLSVLFLVLFWGSFYVVTTGANYYFAFSAGLGLIGFCFCLVYFFVPIDAFTVKGKRGKE